MSTSNVNISQETITPAKANEYLSTVVHNRKLSERVARKYAALMTNGMWIYNGDPIRFDDHGQLIDGQHRLMAITISGKPQRCLMVRGLGEKAFETIDFGKKRALSDLLSIEGFKEVMGLGAAARLMMAYESGIYWAGGTTFEYDQPVPLVLDFVKSRPSFVSGFYAVHKKYLPALRLLTPSVAGFAYNLVYEASPEKTHAFFEGVGSGSNLVEHDPRLLLREKMVAHRIQSKRRMRQFETAALTVKALNSFFAGSPMYVLGMRMHGAKIEQFPKFNSKDK